MRDKIIDFQYIEWDKKCRQLQNQKAFSFKRELKNEKTNNLA